MTGKFLLPNGVELALSIRSDTLVDGRPVLRTVFTVDTAAQLQVFGRQGDVPVTRTPAGSGSSMPSIAPTGVSVLFDRRSGTQTVTPTFAIAPTTMAPTVTATGATAFGEASGAAGSGLSPLAVMPDGAAVATSDGLVSAANVANGVQVTLAGDQLGIAHLVGQSIATAIVNSASDRTIDTATMVDIDLRNAAPLALASAALRVDSLAVDATRGMIR